MGTSKVYTYQTNAKSYGDAFNDRVTNSILTQPIDLDCKLPDTYIVQENGAHLRPRKRKSHCSFTCSSESLYAREAIRPLEPLNWLSTVHLILNISYEDISYIASGAVIASRYVITAAFNVYRRENNVEIDKLDINISARNDIGDRLSKIKVVEIYYPKKYPNTGEEDFALLVLDRDIGAFTGSFGLKLIEDEELEEKSVYLSGYQKNEYDITREGPVEVNITRGFLNHSIDIRNFLIGSVLYYQEFDKYYAIGLITPSSPSQAPQAIHLNSSRIKKLESWIRRYSIKYSIISNLDLSLFPHSISNHLFKLASQGALDSLISLNLSRSSLGSKCVKTISNMTSKTLRSLNLERNEICSKGAREIARGKLCNLAHLNLGENDIDYHGAKALAYGKLKNLINLDLHDNRIGNKGAIFLSRGNFNKLTALNLRRNELGPLAAKGLATGNLLNLRYLNLACNQIGNDGAMILAHGNFIKLQVLDVSSNFIGIEGAATLSKGKLVELNELHLERNNIRERTVARMMRGNTRNPSVGGIRGSLNGDISYQSIVHSSVIS